MFFIKKNTLPEPSFVELVFTVKDQLKVDKIDSIQFITKGRIPNDPWERVEISKQSKPVKLKALWIACYFLSEEGKPLPHAYKKLIQLSNEIGLNVGNVDDMIQVFSKENRQRVMV